jgi:hypothetical protein
VGIVIEEPEKEPPEAKPTPVIEFRREMRSLKQAPPSLPPSYESIRERDRDVNLLNR